MDQLQDKSKSEHVEVADIAAAAHANGVDELPVSWFVYLVAQNTSLAGLLFGYDTGIISAVLVYIKDDLNNRTLTSNEKQLVTSFCSGGAFFGAIFAGLTADRVRFEDSPSLNLTMVSSVAKRQSTSDADFSLSARSCKPPPTPSLKCPSVDAWSDLGLVRQRWLYHCTLRRWHQRALVVD